MIIKHASPGGGYRFNDGIDSVRHDEDHYLINASNRPVPRKVDLFEDSTLYVNPVPDGAPSAKEENNLDLDEVTRGVLIFMDEREGQSGLRPLDLLELHFVTDESGEASDPELTRSEKRVRLAIDMQTFLMTDEGQTIERLI